MADTVASTPTTVGGLLDRPARDHPDKVAVVFGERRTTFRVFRERVDRLANGLLSLGLRPGDRLALFVGNSDRAWEAILACARAGIVWVPINYMLRGRELATVAGHCGARALLVSGNYHATFAAVRGELPAIAHVIGVDGPGSVDYEELIARSDETPPAVEVGPDDVFCLLYTSGTTGLPKGTVLTHRAVLAHAANAIREYRLSQDSVGLVVLPYFVGATLNVIQIPGLQCGARLVFAERFTPASFYRLIAVERVTHIQTVPTLIVRLLAAPETERTQDLSSLVTIGYGSAPMPVDRLRLAVERFGPVFTQIYGLTETCAMATCLRPHEHVLDGPAAQRLASCGRPVDGVKIRVVDEGGRVVPVGERGEIVIRGPTLMRGYWNHTEATARAMRDGWFHTGDIAWRDSDGYLYITDRMNDMIISGGINVYPQEIEQVISTHPAVFEAAVIGLSDPEWGEAVTAVVALRPGTVATAAEIVEHCRQQLAGYKKPRIVHFVDEIPRNPSGKVLKRVLRETYASAR